MRYALLAILLCPAFGFAQTVSGRVTERTTGEGVSRAEILLLDESGHPRMATRSDSSGHYAMRAPRPGPYRLNFSRAGLSAVNGIAARLVGDSTTIVNAVLDVGLTKLSDVTVRARPVVNAPPGNRTKYDEFLRRKAVGMGTFLTREDIDSRPRHRIQEIFNGIPGIKVRENGTTWYLQSQRCSGKSIPGFRIGKPKTAPMIFVDGVRMTDSTYFAQIPPGNIEAVEVYQGAAQLPADARGDSCFAIFVWLR